MLSSSHLRSTLAIACFLGHAGSVLAADCLENFNVDKTPAKGTAFTGFSTQPGSADQFYAAAQAVLEREGWSVASKDAANRAMVAGNRQRTASGRTGTLGLSFADAPGGVSVALVYTNPPGVESPVPAVRAQFCKLAGGIAAASASVTASAATSARTSARTSTAATVPAGPTPADSSAAATAPRAGDPALCLAKACLGMTAEQAAALNLQPTGTIRFSFGPGLGRAYGLDAQGTRVEFSDMGDVDSKLLSQFTARVKTICAMSFASAKLTASDGQPIRLIFRPTIRNGRSVLILTQIDRSLPGNMSKSERQRFEAAAREQYGAAYSTPYPVALTRPTVGVDDGMLGLALRLGLPGELGIPERLMEQPGCSARPRLD